MPISAGLTSKRKQQMFNMNTRTVGVLNKRQSGRAAPRERRNWKCSWLTPHGLVLQFRCNVLWLPCTLLLQLADVGHLDLFTCRHLTSHIGPRGPCFYPPPSCASDRQLSPCQGPSVLAAQPSCSVGMLARRMIGSNFFSGPSFLSCSMHCLV